MSDERDKQFLNFARSELDKSLRDIDDRTAARLAGARARALAAQGKKPLSWLPMGIAAAMTAAVLLLFLWRQEVQPPLEPWAVEDVELLASDADLDVLADLDFYQWLEQSDHAG